MGIGPSSKETTLHHFNDPVTERLRNEPGIDFPGIILQGTPEVYGNKKFIAEMTGCWCQAMRAHGAIVSIDSWGNSHVDFTSVIEAIGKKGIPVVGISFVGNQASFVVTNQYMDTIIDLNKNTSGIETCIVGQNTTSYEDAMKAVEILKHKIFRKYNFPPCNFDEPILQRRLVQRYFQIDEVQFSTSTKIVNNKLLINNAKIQNILKKYHEIRSMKINIINPGEDSIFTNANLDFSPVAVKVSGCLGEGTTHAASGITVMLTGAEAKEFGGFQASNIGSSEGILKDHVVRNKIGTPDDSDIILHFDFIFNEGHARTREGIVAAHMAADEFIEDIRSCLKSLSADTAYKSKEYFDTLKINSPRIVLVKLVSGLGCMYETALFPREPGGCLNSRSIMDVSNMPLFITPSQYKDGVVHSLC